MSVQNQSSEQWALCEEGPWLVSNEGRMMTATTRGGKYSNRHKAGKIIKFRPINSKMKRPYLGSVLSGFDGKKRMVVLHTMVAKYFLGPRPEGMTVNHRDCDKNNCHVSNLEYLSHNDNVEHAVKAGLMVFKHKIPDADVISIRKLFADRSSNGMTVQDIATLFGVCYKTVYDFGYSRRRLSAL